MSSCVPLLYTIHLANDNDPNSRIDLKITIHAFTLIIYIYIYIILQCMKNIYIRLIIIQNDYLATRLSDADIIKPLAKHKFLLKERENINAHLFNRSSSFKYQFVVCLGNIFVVGIIFLTNDMNDDDNVNLNFSHFITFEYPLG